MKNILVSAIEETIARYSQSIQLATKNESQELALLLKEMTYKIMWQVKSLSDLVPEDGDYYEGWEAPPEKEQLNNHEVYIVIGREGYLYIGSGKKGRHKHCLSGTSHVVELNKAVHEGAKLKVIVVFDELSKYVSLEAEKALILLLKPKYNKKVASVSSIDTKVFEMMASCLDNLEAL